jgi:hypothetical protein
MGVSYEQGEHEDQKQQDNREAPFPFFLSWPAVEIYSASVYGTFMSCTHTRPTADGQLWREVAGSGASYEMLEVGGSPCSTYVCSLSSLEEESRRVKEGTQERRMNMRVAMKQTRSISFVDFLSFFGFHYYYFRHLFECPIQTINGSSEPFWSDSSINPSQCHV